MSWGTLKEGGIRAGAHAIHAGLPLTHQTPPHPEIRGSLNRQCVQPATRRDRSLHGKIKSSLVNFLGNTSPTAALKLPRDTNSCGGLADGADILWSTEKGHRHSRRNMCLQRDERTFTLGAQVAAEDFAPAGGRILMKQEKTDTCVLRYAVLILQAPAHSPIVIKLLARYRLVRVFLLRVAAGESERCPLGLGKGKIQSAGV